jgi:hypothetical protein
MYVEMQDAKCKMQTLNILPLSQGRFCILNFAF